MRERRDLRVSDQRGEHMRGMRDRGTGTTESDKAGAAGGGSQVSATHEGAR